MNCDTNNSSSCIQDLVKRIYLLQIQDCEGRNVSGCDKPFLGPIPTNICYNTRPIMLYNCGTLPWSFTYTLNGTEAISDVLRIENVDDGCCTCRILYLDATTNEYMATTEFVTIDLACCGAVRCLPDIYVNLC